MLEFWSARDGSHLTESIRSWLEDEWARRELSPDLLLNRLRETSQGQLQKELDGVFHAIEDQLERPAEQEDLDTGEFCARLDEIIGMIGQPEIEGAQQFPGRLSECINEMARAMATEVEAKLSEMAVSFIELPAFRLPGAEETMRQTSARLRRTLDEYEPILPAWQKESLDLYAKLVTQTSGLNSMGRGSKKAAVARTLLGLMRQYARKRFDALLIRSLVSLYRGMISSAPEYLREVQLCRGRLDQLVQFFGEPPRVQIESYLGPGKSVLPPGCENADAAADKYAADLSMEEMVELDTHMQEAIVKQFHSLAGFCLDKSDNTKTMSILLMDNAREFLSSRLQECNSAAVFFLDEMMEQAAHRDVMQAFDESLPELTSRRANAGAPFCMLSVPDDDAGRRFANLAMQTLRDERLKVVTGSEDIVFHREQNIAPADLPQLGPLARESFDLVCQTEQVSPHSRIDVNWQAAGAE
jgi:hypothetical protein